MILQKDSYQKNRQKFVGEAGVSEGGGGGGGGENILPHLERLLFYVNACTLK